MFQTSKERPRALQYQLPVTGNLGQLIFGNHLSGHCSLGFYIIGIFFDHQHTIIKMDTGCTLRLEYCPALVQDRGSAMH